MNEGAYGAPEEGLLGSDDGHDHTIDIVINDHIVKITWAAAMKSALIAAELEDNPETTQFPVLKSDINPEHVQIIVSWMEHVTQVDMLKIPEPLPKCEDGFLDDFERDLFGQLTGMSVLLMMSTAQYLGVRAFVQKCAAKIASKIVGGTSQANQYFAIEDTEEREGEDPQESKESKSEE